MENQLFGSYCNLTLLVVSMIIGKINDCKKGNKTCNYCAMVHDMLLSISLKRHYNVGVWFSPLNKTLLKKAALKWNNFCLINTNLINIKLNYFKCLKF